MAVLLRLKNGVMASLMINIYVDKIALKCMASNLAAGMIWNAMKSVGMFAAESELELLTVNWTYLNNEMT